MNESRKSRTQTGRKSGSVLYSMEKSGVVESIEYICSSQQTCQEPQELKSCYCQWNPMSLVNFSSVVRLCGMKFSVGGLQRGESEM